MNLLPTYAAAADLAKGHEPQLPLTAMFARAVPTKAKKPPSKASHVVKRTRAARMAQLSPKLSPLGLVPARTIALVLSLDPHDVLAAMQAHGIESPWQSGHCPSEAERWERLLSGWGRGRALAWFDSHPSVESAALRKRFAEFADSMTFATELEAPK